MPKELKEDEDIPFPIRMRGISATDLHAGILAMAYQSHESNNRLDNYGYVKAEKIAHMVEAYVGIDLDRIPVKEAAGPNDYPHLKRVTSRAQKAGFFDFRRENNRYRLRKYRRFDELVTRTRQTLGDQANAVDGLLRLMVPMDTQQAEIICTVFAAWNNLLIEGKQPVDEEIVFEARENWHPDKLQISREKFFSAINWLRANGIVPNGKGKKVIAKVSKKS